MGQHHPLIVDDLLIVNPGRRETSLVALDKVRGAPVGHAGKSGGLFNVHLRCEFWTPADRRLRSNFARWLGRENRGALVWQLVPPTEGDFNVPTPIAMNGGVRLSPPRTTGPGSIVLTRRAGSFPASGGVSGPFSRHGDARGNPLTEFLHAALWACIVSMAKPD